MYFSKVESSIWWSTLIIFRLSVQPFSGSVGEAAPPPVGFLPRLAQSDFLPLLIIFQVVSQHLVYLLLMDSQPFPIWEITRGIRSNLEGPFLFWCLQHFWGGSEVVRKISPLLLRERAFMFHPTYSRFSALVAGSAIYPLICCGSLCYIDCPKSLPDSWWFRSSRKDCFAIASNIPGSFNPAFCWSRLRTKKVSIGRFPSLWQTLECSRLSSVSLIRRG